MKRCIICGGVLNSVSIREKVGRGRNDVAASPRVREERLRSAAAAIEPAAGVLAGLSAVHVRIAILGAALARGLASLLLSSRRILPLPARPIAAEDAVTRATAFSGLRSGFRRLWVLVVETIHTLAELRHLASAAITLLQVCGFFGSSHGLLLLFVVVLCVTLVVRSEAIPDRVGGDDQ